MENRKKGGEGKVLTLVASLESGAHHTNVTRAVKGVITTAVGHLNQLLLDALAAQLGGVDEVGRAKLLTPLLLGVVDVDDDDLVSAVLHASLNDGEPDAAGAEYGDVGPLLDTAVAGADDGCTVAGGDAAAEQAGAVHGRLVGDLDDGDVCDDGVLGEGGGSHEVQQVLALALEARGAVGHHAFALGCADLAAEVGLA